MKNVFFSLLSNFFIVPLHRTSWEKSGEYEISVVCFYPYQSKSPNFKVTGERLSQRLSVVCEHARMALTPYSLGIYSGVSVCVGSLLLEAFGDA